VENKQRDMRKTIVIIIIQITSSILCYGQGSNTPNSFHYSYDAVGNRIKREMIHIPPRLADTSLVYDSKFKNHNIKIYPNPTSGNLSVELTNMEEGTTVLTQIFNLNGKLILQKRSNGEKEEMDIGNQPQGNYIMRITLDKVHKEWTIVKM